VKRHPKTPAIPHAVVKTSRRQERDPNDGALKPIAEMAPLNARDARALRALGIFVHPDRRIITD
jgi:hypothetical protein